MGVGAGYNRVGFFPQPYTQNPYLPTHRSEMDPILIKARDETLRLLKIDAQSCSFDTEDAVHRLIDLYQHLWVLYGGDEELMVHWLKTGNSHLGYTPILRVSHPFYLSEMVDYLASFRYY